MPRLHTALFLPAVALLLGFMPGEAAAADRFALMTVEELSRALGAPDLKVFDANSPSTFAKGHLPGAVNVDYEDMEEAELPADKATRVVFYCKSRF
jgi:3-mercaptopyruvate sulfurtransferase SseA